jgi:hypothetical protein
MTGTLRAIMSSAYKHMTGFAETSQHLHLQGSLHQDVLCTSRDCPIFYRR